MKMVLIACQLDRKSTTAASAEEAQTKSTIPENNGNKHPTSMPKKPSFYNNTAHQ